MGLNSKVLYVSTTPEHPLGFKPENSSYVLLVVDELSHFHTIPNRNKE